jgi:hypothetical protein
MFLVADRDGAVVTLTLKNDINADLLLFFRAKLGKSAAAA